MKNLIKIRDISLKYDISTRALKYYEDMGLLNSTKNDGYAYRLYDEEAVKRLEQVLILRKLNISIKDIQRIFNTAGSEVVLDVLSQKTKDIDEEVALLQELKEIVLKFIRQIKQADFNKDSDVKLLYEKAREIESQIINTNNGILNISSTPIYHLVNEDNEENSVDLNRLVEVSDKLNKLRVSIGENEHFTEGISGLEIGSIIELNKKANEWVDLFMNEKLVAKGSVVIVEDNFAIKIEEMITDNASTS